MKSDLALKFGFLATFRCGFAEHCIVGGQAREPRAPSFSSYTRYQHSTQSGNCVASKPRLCYCVVAVIDTRPEPLPMCYCFARTVPRTFLLALSAVRCHAAGSTDPQGSSQPGLSSSATLLPCSAGLRSVSLPHALALDYFPVALHIRSCLQIH